LFSFVFTAFTTARLGEIVYNGGTDRLLAVTGYTVVPHANLQSVSSIMSLSKVAVIASPGRGTPTTR